MKQLIEETSDLLAREVCKGTNRITENSRESGVAFYERIKSVSKTHVKQSLKQFIDEMIAREEGEIKEFQAQKDGEYHFGENQKTIGWNLAKEFTIAHLKKLKEELN